MAVSCTVCMNGFFSSSHIYIFSVCVFYNESKHILYHIIYYIIKVGLNSQMYILLLLIYLVLFVFT